MPAPLSAFRWLISRLRQTRSQKEPYSSLGSAHSATLGKSFISVSKLSLDKIERKGYFLVCLYFLTYDCGFFYGDCNLWCMDCFL